MEDRKTCIPQNAGQDIQEDIVSVLLAGVGGQGIILAAAILAEAARLGGLEVKQSEIHGMSQRGGSVVSSVRLGRQVFSPTIDRADFIVALEKLEALRYTHRLKKAGLMLISDYEIAPVSLFTSKQQYPSHLEDKIAKTGVNCQLVDAQQAACQIGHPKTVNVIMLGVLSRHMDLSLQCWLQSIEQNVPLKAVDINLEAFRRGRQY